MPKEISAELAKVISWNKHLEQLLLSNNNLGSSTIIILQVLGKMSILKVLDLQSNQIAEEAGKYFASVICNNFELHQLFVDNNNIGKGMLPIVKTLQKLNSLQVLCLGNTKFPKEAANDLALVIECNQCLNTLQLNDNDLQCSAGFILQALSKISSLRLLDLQSNQLNRDSGEYLSSVILNNVGINQLLLGNNDLGKGVLPIVKALQKLNSLQVLSLGSTRFTKEVFDELALVIECNQCL